jgi:hypothetical protein
MPDSVDQDVEVVFLPRGFDALRCDAFEVLLARLRPSSRFSIAGRIQVWFALSIRVR